MAADTALPTGIRRVILVAAATLGTAAYDFTWTVVGIGLPHMQGAFSATTDQVAWVLTGFIVGSAMMTSTVGWVTAKVGRKQLFMFALAGYTITLIGCGMSSTLISEVVWRFIQGVVGAPLIPLGQAITVDAFPPERHGKATSIWAIAVVAGGAFGPAFGGVLINKFGWPWIFYITIPVGVVSLIAAWIVIPETPNDPTRKLDWFGCATLLTAIATLMLVLGRGERLGWFASSEIILEVMAASIAFYLFIAHTMTSKLNFIDKALFRNRNYTIGLLFLLLFASIVTLPMFLLPILLQQVAGYPAIEAGYLLIPRGIGVIMGLLFIGQIEHLMDPRKVIFVCLLFVIYTGWEMSQWTVDVRAWDVIWPNFIQGVTSGMMWVPVSALALSTIERRWQADGYAIFYLQFDIGSAIGVAGIVALNSRHAQINRATLVEHVNPYNELLNYPEISSIWNIAETEGLALLDLEIGRQAAMIAYNNSFLMITLGAAMLLPLTLLFRPPQRAR